LLQHPSPSTSHSTDVRHGVETRKRRGQRPQRHRQATLCIRA
jgi:hypothetical protein